MTRFLPLLALFLLLAGCAPAVAAAQAPAGPARPAGQDYNATLSAAQSQATGAAEQRAAAQAATQQANADRDFALQATAQAQAAQQERERQRLEAAAQGATLAAQTTLSALSVQGTMQAYTSTATAGAILAAVQATQAASAGQVAASTAQAAWLEASAEPRRIADRDLATAVGLRIAPTITAQAVARQQARLDNSWSTLSGFCGFGLLLIGAAVAWGLTRILRVVEGGVAIRAALPPTVTVLPAQPAPPQVESIPPAPEIEPATPAGPEGMLKRFVLDCARLVGWDATRIPSDDKFREAGVMEWASGRAWTVATGKLAQRGLIVKAGEAANAPYEVDGGTLRELYRAI